MALKLEPVNTKTKDQVNALKKHVKAGGGLNAQVSEVLDVELDAA